MMIEDSMKNLQPLINLDSLSPIKQFKNIWNGLPAGATKSASSFSDVNKVVAETTILFNLMAVNCLTFSLTHTETIHM